MKRCADDADADAASDPSKRARRDPDAASPPLLWHDHDQRVCVLDIPASIQHAQAFGSHAMQMQLDTAARPPRRAPFDAHHPPCAPSPRESAWNHIYVAECRRALAAAHAFFTRREIRNPLGARLGTADRHSGPAADPPEAPTSRTATSAPLAAVGSTRQRVLPSVHVNHHHHLPEFVFSDDNNNAAAADAADNLDPTRRWHTYRIPPRAGYALGFVENTTLFQAALRAYAPPAGRLDVVVLDPPWLNASADRKGSYKTSDFRSLKTLLLDMDLDRYLKAGALLAVWVTNSQAARNLVLGPGGVFEQCQATLKEECIWLKVTATGEPITSLNRLDRKPYEVLLVGQVCGGSSSSSSSSNPVPRQPPTQRTIIASPDVHSRKPNVKYLVEHLWLDPALAHDYKACEIFARNLTAGWLAWGNECLLFNSLGHWRDCEDKHPSLTE